MNADPWELMALPRGAPARDVKRRYAQLLKLNRPDENPGGFQMLRWAYEICLAHAGPASDSTPDDARQPAFAAETAVASVVAVQSPPQPAGAIEPPTDDTPPSDTGTRPSSMPPPVAASVSAHEWLGLDRLEALRSPVAVVDELLAAADPARVDGEVFDAWFARCPELSNFAAREAIERELLGRLAASDTQLSYEAFSALDHSYGWSQIGFERRLLAGGMSPALVQRVVAALDHCLIDAQFARHLAERDALFNRTPERWHAVLGDADGERAELRRLHAERASPRWRLLRALRPSVVNVVNQLFYAYTARCGAAAVDRLFGADAVRFWNRAHPGTPPNLTQIGLSALRWLLGFAAFGLFATGIIMSPDDPHLGEALRNLWLGVFASALVAVAGATAWRWLRFVGVPRYAQWRETFKRGVESYLEPAIAIPVLSVGTVAGVAFALGDNPYFGPGRLALVALAVIGFVLGGPAAVSSAIALVFGRYAIENTFGDGTFYFAAGAALLPGFAWLCDRIAVRTTGWPNAANGARERRTFWLLVGTTFAMLVASLIWGPHALGT